MTDETKRDSTAVMARRHPRRKTLDDVRAALGGGLVKPGGGLSVMQDRRTRAPDALDYFPTPPWAARAGGELIRRLDPAARRCWEPACGEGHMAAGLADYFDELVATDVFDYGFGGVLDFLGEEASAERWRGFDWIVTNPPFVAGADFVRLALQRARRGVGILARAAFLESAERFPLFAQAHVSTDPTAAAAFALYAPFAERVPMVKGRWDPDAASATAYAWFFWLKRPFRAAALPIGVAAAQDAGASLVQVIPPGTKARLSRSSDLARFCTAEPAAGDLLSRS